MEKSFPLFDENMQRAVEARRSQGKHETEISINSESDLQRAYIDCLKHPGHDCFTPIRELCLETMPEKFRYPFGVEFVKLKAHETVRLSCPYTSLERPDDYTFGNYKGSDITRVGSGRVWSVYKENTKADIPCPFPDCTEIKGPHTVSGILRIHTAKHVVFDDAEAQQTIVDFFYDSPDDRSNVIRARGLRVTSSDLDRDYCVMECVTHDPTLCSKLDHVRRQWSLLWPRVQEVISGTDIAFVISHPHGCSKQLSVGKCLQREWGQVNENQSWYRYSFDAATCPGCSGCPVWVPGGDGLVSGYAPHSGCESKNLNKSATWFFWKSSGAN